MKLFLFKFKLGYYYYKNFIVISLLLTTFLTFLGNVMEVILLVKLFLLSLIFLENRFLSSKDRWLFYKNFGITPRFLFISVFILDFFISVVIFKLTHLFI